MPFTPFWQKTQAKKMRDSLFIFDRLETTAAYFLLSFNYIIWWPPTNGDWKLDPGRVQEHER
jgi:hypothetical protein